MSEFNHLKKDLVPNLNKPMVEVTVYNTKQQAEHLDKTLPSMRLPESIEPLFEAQLRDIAKSVEELNLSEDIEFQSLSNYDQKVFIINLVVGYFEGWKVFYQYDGLAIPENFDFVDDWYSDTSMVGLFASRKYLNLSIESDFKISFVFKNIWVEEIISVFQKIIGAEIYYGSVERDKLGPNIVHCHRIE